MVAAAHGTISVVMDRDMGASLSDADLAAVLTCIRESWGNKNGAVSADQIKAARAAISGKPQSAANLPK